VIFDLDGTLLDTIEDLADTMNAVLARFGHPEHPVDAYRTFVGDGVGVLVQRAFPPHARDEATVRAGGLVMREEYAKRFDVKTRPYPGIPETLDALFKRKLPVAILSNKPDDFAQVTVERLLPGYPFTFVVGSKPDVPKKPDPTAALKLAADLGIPPAEILYVGDTNTDMLTAKSAGMFAAGASWGFRDAVELRANGADVILEEPTEILKLCDS
jgi:phosphoglycolate phosphatase